MSQKLETDFSFGQLRHELQNENLPTLREAGLLTPRAIEILERYKRTYEPNSGKHHETGAPAYWYYNTEFYTRVVRNEVGKTLSRAVLNGNYSVVRHAIGIVSPDTSDADFVRYEQLRELIKERGLVLILSGATKSGKTATAFRLVELAQHAWSKPVKLATHIKSAAEENEDIDYIQTDEELKEWTIENQDSIKYFIGDEAHEWGTGYSHHAQAIQNKLSSFVRLAGKEPYNVRMILICHRAGGMHPALQNDELCYYARKEGDTLKQKRRNLVLYDTLHGDKLKDEKFRVKTSDTNIKYSPHDTTPFIIEHSNDENNDEQDQESNEPEWHSCRGEKVGGDSCAQAHGLCPHGYCKMHRSQCEDCNPSES